MNGSEAHAQGETYAQGAWLSLDGIPFLVHLGVQWRDVRPGIAELRLEQQTHHQNSLGMAHGGVVMTLLDVAMARACRSLTEPGEAIPSLITIEMKTTSMQPATGLLRAEGRVLRRTASLAFCEADVFDDHERLAARASGTFRYVKPRSPSP
jgi:uncharacterized protein (TIGR00369 family)